jgi:hypothetical protein
LAEYGIDGVPVFQRARASVGDDGSIACREKGE